VAVAVAVAVCRCRCCCRRVEARAGVVNVGGLEW
jgi:hypothetical protein